MQRFADGTMQFRCPQCSGRVDSNLTTHNTNVSVNRDAPYLTTNETENAARECPSSRWNGWTNGSSSHGAPKLGRPPITVASKWENGNSILKRNGGLNNLFCRTKGIAAHTFAVLALAIAHNLNLAKTDPYAANISRDESADSDADGSPANADSTDSDEGEEDTGDNRLRAPP